MRLRLGPILAPAMVTLLFSVLPSNAQTTSPLDIAQRFAPVIYQDVDEVLFNGIDDRKFDLITGWDFDNDGNIATNWVHAGELPASEFLPYVYYSVVETRTHYFLGYFFYHSRDWEFSFPTKGLWPEHEHDFEGMTLVVNKPALNSSDIVLAYTQAHDDTYYFFPNGSSASVYDATADDSDCLLFGSLDHRDHLWGSLSHCGSMSSVEFTQLLTIDDPFGDNRPCAFIESNGHGVGQLLRAGPIHLSGFYGGDGVAYVPSPTNTPDAPPSSVPNGATVLAYGLLPFDAEIFAHRFSSADPTLFLSGPDDLVDVLTIRGAGIKNVGHVFRGGGTRDDGAKAPWAWPEHNTWVDPGAEVVAQLGSTGDWLLDPAWMVREHATSLAPEGPASWDIDYLYNPYLMGSNILSVGTPPGGPIGTTITLTWIHGQSPADESTPLRAVGDLFLVNSATLDRVHSIASNLALSPGSANWTIDPSVAAGSYRLELTCAFSIAGDDDPVPSMSSISEPFTIQASTNAPETNPPAWLESAVPNPFNPVTSISFGTKNGGHVDLTVFDLAGRKVKNLVDGFLEGGSHSRQWKGRDEDNRLLPAGVYICRLQAGGSVEVMRLVLLN